jgi:CMP-N-acetylneuraminic acid synthetase
MKFIAIIPARTNSKRLPNKNFKEFFGKPIINWVIDEVCNFGFNTIVVSTDNEFQDSRVIVDKRPDHLLTDKATVDEVCKDVLERYLGYDYICCIYPTAYAITSGHLLGSFSLMMNLGFEHCQSVGMINHKRYGVEYDIDNGGFYFAPTNFEKLVGVKRGIEIPQVDINTQEDFDEAVEHARTLEIFQ